MKKLKILHSNDIHADFFSDDKSASGIMELDASVSKYKDENTLYFISGDVLNGSIIDKEYKGISTFELLNIVSPDLMCVGNHEFDYGSTWPLLLEKVADFPMICSNVYVRGTDKRLFTPYKLFSVNGLNIAVIGLLTGSTSTKLKQQDNHHLIEVKEKYHEEVKNITEELKNIDIDLTICLTHLGYEEDLELAKALDKNCGIDIIIGGHSHTYLDKPTLCNGILLVQAGEGADHLGYFELEVDEDTNSIENYKWSLLETSKTEPNNQKLQTKLFKYKNIVDEKYNKILTLLPQSLEHKDRSVQTSASKFIADLFPKDNDTSVVLMHGGFTRKEFIPKEITLKTIHESWPFTNALHLVKINGKVFKEFLFINAKNVASKHFCCPSSNIEISLENNKPIDIKINNYDIDYDKEYSFIFSQFILTSMIDNGFLNRSDFIAEEIFCANANKYIIELLNNRGT